MDGGSGALLARAINLADADKAYFLERAEAELERAQTSSDPEAVRCHYELAGLYLDLVYNEDAFAEWKLSRALAAAPADGERRAEPILLEFGQMLPRPLRTKVQLLPSGRG